MQEITPETVLATLGGTAVLTLTIAARDYRDAIKCYHKKIQEIDSDPQLSLLEKGYPERPTYLGVLKDRFEEIKDMVWPW